MLSAIFIRQKYNQKTKRCTMKLSINQNTEIGVDMAAHIAKHKNV